MSETAHPNSQYKIEWRFKENIEPGQPWFEATSSSLSALVESGEFASNQDGTQFEARITNLCGMVSYSSIIVPHLSGCCDKSIAVPAFTIDAEPTATDCEDFDIGPPTSNNGRDIIYSVDVPLNPDPEHPNSDYRYTWYLQGAMVGDTGQSLYVLTTQTSQTVNDIDEEYTVECMVTNVCGVTGSATRTDTFPTCYDLYSSANTNSIDDPFGLADIS